MSERSTTETILDNYNLKQLPPLTKFIIKEGKLNLIIEHSSNIIIILFIIFIGLFYFLTTETHIAIIILFSVLISILILSEFFPKENKILLTITNDKIFWNNYSTDLDNIKKFKIDINRGSGRENRIYSYNLNIITHKKVKTQINNIDVDDTIIDILSSMDTDYLKLVISIIKDIKNKKLILR